MAGYTKGPDKKTIVAIIIVAILVIAAIVGTVVFLKNRGTTEATDLASYNEQATGSTQEETRTTESQEQAGEPATQSTEGQETEVTEPTEEPEITSITLNDILNNFNNNSIIKQLQETNEINASIDNNKLIISVKTIESDTPALYEYLLEDRMLKTTINTSDLTANILFLVIADNIGQFHGTPENETYNLLSSIDFTAAQIDGITYTINNENIDISINIDKKIDTSSLKTMYIETSDLKKYDSFINGSGSIQFDKGNLMFYKYGDDKITTIIIAEKDSLTNLTYKSILSIVEFLYPDELETFQTSYPELTTIAFNRYTITENPELTGIVETLFDQYKDQYKFIEIKVNKD